jgi:hypothetical protein
LKTAYILVGVPGAGKTTWINNQSWSKDHVIISTDKYVEKFARRLNKTYSEVFDLVTDRASLMMIN